MGLTIEVQDECGGTVSTTTDPKNLLTYLLPEFGDTSYPMLGCIDPYGDTTFNRPQMALFLAEWVVVCSKTKTTEEKALATNIESMAQHVRDNVHLYLKFIGD
jgi:hypothetical protein